MTLCSAEKWVSVASVSWQGSRQHPTGEALWNTGVAIPSRTNRIGLETDLATSTSVQADAESATRRAVSIKKADQRYN